MIYCPDYNNPDEYVREHYHEEADWVEATKCDCGEACYNGNVYCEYCKDVIDTAMRKAMGNIIRWCGYTREDAAEAIAYWLTYPEQFKEE